MKLNDDEAERFGAFVVDFLNDSDWNTGKTTMATLQNNMSEYFHPVWQIDFYDSLFHITSHDYDSTRLLKGFDDAFQESRYQESRYVLGLFSNRSEVDPRQNEPDTIIIALFKADKFWSEISRNCKLVWKITLDNLKYDDSGYTFSQHDWKYQKVSDMALTWAFSDEELDWGDCEIALYSLGAYDLYYENALNWKTLPLFVFEERSA
jgi:hypothetical protein